MRFWACPFYSSSPPLPSPPLCGVCLENLQWPGSAVPGCSILFLYLFCFLTRVKLANRHVPDAYRQLSWLQVLTIVTFYIHGFAPTSTAARDLFRKKKQKRKSVQNFETFSFFVCVLITGRYIIYLDDIYIFLNLSRSISKHPIILSPYTHVPNTYSVRPACIYHHAILITVT